MNNSFYFHEQVTSIVRDLADDVELFCLYLSLLMYSQTSQQLPLGISVEWWRGVCCFRGCVFLNTTLMFLRTVVSGWCRCSANMVSGYHHATQYCNDNRYGILPAVNWIVWKRGRGRTAKVSQICSIVRYRFIYKFVLLSAQFCEPGRNYNCCHELWLKVTLK